MKSIKKSKNIEVLYTVRVPYTMLGHEIIVYWDHMEQAWDWCVVDGDLVIKAPTRQGYGVAEVALRDALIELTA